MLPLAMCKYIAAAAIAMLWQPLIIQGGVLPIIDGGAAAVDKGNLNNTYVLQVIPKFISWFLYFPASVTIASTDTVLLTFQQKVFRQNFPSGNFLITTCNSPTNTFPAHTNYMGAIGHYWMGWWYSALTKTKNGITTTKTDSFYIPWNKNATDTIPW